MATFVLSLVLLAPYRFTSDFRTAVVQFDLQFQLVGRLSEVTQILSPQRRLSSHDGVYVDEFFFALPIAVHCHCVNIRIWPTILNAARHALS
ncbi:hypothetical protein AMD26_019125 [Deinococcus sp. UR1]|nr:hypothetical protein AMD26_019125 [Deinococcus sp. UR1]